MSAKVFVRYQLWINGAGGENPAGGRLAQGQAIMQFPEECKNGFVFDDLETAQRAAIKLENYVNKTAEKQEPKRSKKEE